MYAELLCVCVIVCVCVCVCVCVFMSFYWGGLFLWKMIKRIYISMHVNDVMLYQPLSSLFLDLCYFTPKDKIPTILLITGKNITCDVWRSTVMKEFIYIYIYIYDDDTTYGEKIRKIERLLWPEFFHSGSRLWHWHKEDPLILIKYSSVTPTTTSNWCSA